MRLSAVLVSTLLLATVLFIPLSSTAGINFVTASQFCGPLCQLTQTTTSTTSSYCGPLCQFTSGTTTATTVCSTYQNGNVVVCNAYTTVTIQAYFTQCQGFGCNNPTQHVLANVHVVIEAVREGRRRSFPLGQSGYTDGNGQVKFSIPTGFKYVVVGTYGPFAPNQNADIQSRYFIAAGGTQTIVLPNF